MPELLATPRLAARSDAEARWIARLAKLRVPRAYLDVPHDAPIPAPLLDWPAKAAFVVISGPVGVGKTFLAVRLFGERFDLVGARFADALDALAAMKADMGTGTDGVTFDRLREARALLLDDLGAGRPTEYSREVWTEVLRYRHSRRLPTILTTNADGLEGLAASPSNPMGFDAAVVSRCGERAIHWPMTGRDRRA